MTTDQVRELIYNPGTCPLCSAKFPVISLTLDHIAKIHE